MSCYMTKPFSLYLGKKYLKQEISRFRNICLSDNKNRKRQQYNKERKIVIEGLLVASYTIRSSYLIYDLFIESLFTCCLASKNANREGAGCSIENNVLFSFLFLIDKESCAQLSLALFWRTKEEEEAYKYRTALVRVICNVIGIYVVLKK
jgi:hypothetical protein